MRKAKRWVAVAVMGWVAASCAGVRAKAAGLAAITVVVYNYAGVPPEVLGNTKRVAGRVLRVAGVKIRWRNAPLGPISGRNGRRPQDEFGTATLVLRLLPEKMTRRLGFQPNHYGFALLAEGGGFPFAAAVFCDRAERLAMGTPSMVPIILGHLMAHEIGHLLLAPEDHSGAGIMSAPWGEAQLQMARRGGLLFTADEAETLRAEVQERLAALDASGGLAEQASAQ